MARIKTFTFRINAQELEIISELSKQLQRSRSDALRWILKQAHSQLDTNPDLAVDQPEEVQHESK